MGVSSVWECPLCGSAPVLSTIVKEARFTSNQVLWCKHWFSYTFNEGSLFCLWYCWPQLMIRLVA